MSFTWLEIEQDWLGGNPIGVPADDVVAAFETVERILGRNHVESHRTREGVTTMGTLPTMAVVDLGRRLMSLDRVMNPSKLIGKLKAGDASAYAELTAVYLLHDQDLEIDLEPEVDVAGSTKRPDFRARKPGAPWLYVEVTQPDVSDAQREIESRRQPLFSLLSIKRSFAIEIYLRRDPTDDELTQLMTRATELCKRDDQLIEEVGTIGFLLLNQTAPGMIVPKDPPGEPARPILGAMRGLSGGEEPPRHVVVRTAYSDERAEKLLQREAKQLPKDAPAMVMFDMANAPGGAKAWKPLLERRLQPTINTRISAIGMFRSGHEPEGLIHRVTLLGNPYAKQPLPSWASKGLERFAQWKASVP